jgi:urea transport system permease protein
VWTAVGGRGTLIGPIIGAIHDTAGKSFFTGAFPEFWLYALGSLFIAVTLFLPRGIVGTVQHGLKARDAMKAAAEAERGRDAGPPVAQAAE